ncbi:hypothetical protein [Enterococcus sp. AZ109]
MMTIIAVIVALGIVSQIVEALIDEDAVKDFVIKHLGKIPADEK